MFGMMGAISAGSEIASIVTSGAPASLISISGNGNHDTMDSSGRAVGFWSDGPCVSYKGGDGNHYAIFPHSENFRMTVPNWTSGGTWTGLTNCYNSPRTAGEGQYANRIWIFGTYATGNTVYALGHMEWYQTRTTGDTDVQWGTLDGWNGYAPAKRQVMSPIWLKSTDNGATWAIKPTGGDRTVLKPEPWATQSRDTFYGFRHPSNIMHEDGYYYAFLDYLSLPGSTNLLNQGFCAVRTNDLESSTNWEYWNGSGWTANNRSSYQGNLATQQPHQFFGTTGWDPYTDQPPTCRMAQALCWHVPTEQWLLFGFRSDVAGFFCYSRSKTLANPRWEQNGATIISLGAGDSGSNYIGARYISVFDENATDQNLRQIGNNPICITAENDRTGFRYNRLTINVV